jgi:hypothetical protein
VGATAEEKRHDRFHCATRVDGWRYWRRDFLLASSRASTSWPHARKEDVDGRDEPGHDGEMSCSLNSAITTTAAATGDSRS